MRSIYLAIQAHNNNAIQRLQSCILRLCICPCIPLLNILCICPCSILNAALVTCCKALPHYTSPCCQPKVVVAYCTCLCILCAWLHVHVHVCARTHNLIYVHVTNSCSTACIHSVGICKCIRSLGFQLFQNGCGTYYMVCGPFVQECTVFMLWQKCLFFAPCWVMTSDMQFISCSIQSC